MDQDKLLTSSLTPAIWVYKLYGCFPFSFRQYEYGSGRLKILFVGIAYGAVLVSTAAAYRIASVILSRVPSQSPIVKSTAILGSIGTLGSFTSYIFYIKNIRNTYVNLLEYSKQLINEKYLRNVRWLTMAEVFVSEILILGFYVAYYFSYPTRFFIGDNIAGCYLRHVITVFRFQFANSVLFLCSAFRVANEGFFEIFTSKKLSLEINPKKSGDKSKNVTSIISSYTKATDSCQILNTCFGPTLAVASVCMILQVVLCCYSLVVKSINISMFFFWFCSYIAEEWFVLHACEKVIRETKKTGALVHNLMAQTKDPRLKDQLHEFSLQLLHRKIKFTACGLFPLNYSLIYTTAGAVTTYLVVLIQFQTATDAGKSSSGSI